MERTEYTENQNSLFLFRVSRGRSQPGDEVVYGVAELPEPVATPRALVWGGRAVG
jgi:hypothetical protein